MITKKQRIANAKKANAAWQLKYGKGKNLAKRKEWSRRGAFITNEMKYIKKLNYEKK